MSIICQSNAAVNFILDRGTGFGVRVPAPSNTSICIVVAIELWWMYLVDCVAKIVILHIYIANESLVAGLGILENLQVLEILPAWGGTPGAEIRR